MKTFFIRGGFIFLAIGLGMSMSVFAQTLPTATQIASQMKIGWNHGNSMEVPGDETGWGNPPATQALINGVKAAGFNTVRIPCAWDSYANQSTLQISSAWLARVKEVVDYCYNNNMYVILNSHWDNGWLEEHPFYANQAEVNEKQDAYWTQIANYFASYDEHLLFAGTNEVRADYGEPTNEYITVQESYNQTFINAVRNTGGNNQQRTLIVQTYNTNAWHGLNYFTLPNDPASGRLMVEVHYYDAYDFALNPDNNACSQWDAGNCSWAGPSYVEDLFGQMQQRWVNQGIPVVIGEYGALKRPSAGSAREAERLDWLEYITDAAFRHGMVPVYWDNGVADQFGLFNRSNGNVIDQAGIDAMMAAVSCTPSTITPYVQINGGSWQQTSSVTVNSGATVKLGPQPASGGSWSWTGCGTSGSSREQTFTASNTCSATATYTNSSGCQSSQTFNITVNGGGSGNITVRARGVQGSEQIQLKANGNTIGTWTLGTSYQNYSANGSGTITVQFINDDGGRDVQCDYVIIDGTTYQSEDQATNTAVWQSSQCGGSYSEWLHCNGYIQYGTSGGGITTETIQENNTGFCSVDGTIDSNNSGYTGTGFANTSNANGNGITWSVSVSGGSYTLVWRYANGSSDRSAQIMVDGSTVSNYTFGGTGSWTSWSNSSSVNVNLSSGTRNIRLQATNSAGLPNMDNIQITGAGISPVSCPGVRNAGEIAQTPNDGIIKIYPNPVTENQLNIDLSNFEGTSLLRVFDLSGKMFIENQIPEGRLVKMDINLNAGMYMLQVINHDETITRKFIKE